MPSESHAMPHAMREEHLREPDRRPSRGDAPRGVACRSMSRLERNSITRAHSPTVGLRLTCLMAGARAYVRTHIITCGGRDERTLGLNDGVNLKLI